MSKKQKPNKDGLVYSTDPGFSFQQEEDGNVENIPPPQQKLRVYMDTKHRGGKTVTIVSNFTGSEQELETLGKELKTFCGTGGSVKDGEILVQGDQRQKVIQFLKKKQFGVKG